MSILAKIGNFERQSCFAAASQQGRQVQVLATFYKALSSSSALFGKVCIMNEDRKAGRTNSFRWYKRFYIVINPSLNRRL